MDFIQNHKINQVTENTLVIGMDIAKRTYYACFVDDRGRMLKKPFAISQSRDGFEGFYDKILEAIKEFDKTKVLTGIEPTGHYWLNLAYFIADRGIPLAMINPMHVKRSKELDDNLPTKHDRKDALVIARLLKDGGFSYPRILRDVEAELCTGAPLKGRLTEELGSVKNMMIRWLDRYFPEFRTIFPAFGKMALAALEQTALPQDVQGKELEELLTLYRKVDGLSSSQKPRAARLIEVSNDSIGMTEGLAMVRLEVAILVRRFRQLQICQRGCHCLSDRSGTVLS